MQILKQYCLWHFYSVLLITVIEYTSLHRITYLNLGCLALDLYFIYFKKKKTKQKQNQKISVKLNKLIGFKYFLWVFLFIWVCVMCVSKGSNIPLCCFQIVCVKTSSIEQFLLFNLEILQKKNKKLNYYLWDNNIYNGCILVFMWVFF